MHSVSSLVQVLLPGPAFVQHEQHSNLQYLTMVWCCLQAIHNAVIAAGVPEPLAAGKVNSLLPLPTPAQQQLARATAGTLSSAQSTITLNAVGADQVQDSGPCRASAAAGLEIARQKRMSSEVGADSSCAGVLAQGCPQARIFDGVQPAGTDSCGALLLPASHMIQPAAGHCCGRHSKAVHIASFGPLLSQLQIVSSSQGMLPC
jgi:hypothetical protein